MSLQPPPKQRLWIWFLWLICFYSTWLFLVFALQQWPLVKDHWPMALSMALGSYVAGSTPMGGGTVGFPVLVLLFKMPATLGRDFSFAIQSIGMTSASIFILCRRQPLATSMLRGAMIGSLFGTPLGVLFLAPLIPELWIKLVFAVVWASFGILHLYRLREIAAHSGMTEFSEGWDFKLGLGLGFCAGVSVAAVTGVGIDMVIYSALVLLCRADLKIAIPTSVVLMAFTSLVGVAVKFTFGSFEPGVYGNWMAAAPVVALGAPLGAFIVGMIGRKPTLFFVAILCVLQFVWTCHSQFKDLGWLGIGIACIAVMVFLIIFEELRQWGGRLAGDDEHK